MAGRAYGKTVWSWPSLLRSSLSRRCERAQPGRLHHPIRGAREARRKVRLPGEHGISRPTIAQGRPSDRRHLYAAVRSSCATFAQQTAGASWHPAFPAPSWISEGRKMKQSSGEQAARLRRRVCESICLPQTRSRRVGKAQRAHASIAVSERSWARRYALLPTLRHRGRDVDWGIAMPPHTPSLRAQRNQSRIPPRKDSGLFPPSPKASADKSLRSQ